MSHLDRLQSKAEVAPVARDNSGRFKLLFTNSRPHIPGGKLAPLSMRPTRVLIRERMQAVADSQKK